MKQYPPPGEPQTFVELLAEAERAGGDGVVYRQRSGGGWRQLSFRELGERARAVAAGLHGLGIRKGDRVVMVLENSIEWPIAFFGIVAAGGVAVPIYYGLKENEIDVMFEHADPSAAVVSGSTLPQVRAHLERLKVLVVVDDERGLATAREQGAAASLLLSLEQLEGRASDESRRALAALAVQPADLAAILFTSGTSAGHKGVMLTHHNLMANVAQSRRVIPFGPGDRLLLVLPLHHSFPFMITVGMVPAMRGELIFENDLRRIRDRMAEVRPTIFLGVPALFEMMLRNVLQAIESQGRMPAFRRAYRIARLVKRVTGINIAPILFKDLHRRLGGKIKVMVSGGAALSPDVQREFLALGLPLIQGWGLSEASPGLAIQRWSRWRFRYTRYFERRIGSIGPPLPGVEVRLLDVPDKGLFVNVHKEGELIARGDNITPGYWRAPDLTKDLKADEWLRTGDLGSIDRHGEIRITGRSKFIIVLDSGEKVYPDEVEDQVGDAPVIEDIAIRGTVLRDKTQVTAIIYPNRDEVLKVLGDRPPTPQSVREVVVAAVRAGERDVAAYKRIYEIFLSDEPLPRTPLRKIMRGNLLDAYTFDIDRWSRSWAELQAATAE